MDTLILNAWDLKQIEEKGFVETGKYIVMSRAKHKELLKSK